MKAFKVKRFIGFDFQVTGSVRKRYAASWNNVVKLYEKGVFDMITKKYVTVEMMADFNKVLESKGSIIRLYKKN